jgi:exonuclease III
MDSNNNNNRSCKILFWNVRGINSQDKWDAIRDKITESAYQVLCLQETKRESFDIFYIKKFCPRSPDQFAFFPSIGASSGLLAVWNSSIFEGSVDQSKSYAITVKLCCRMDNKEFFVTNIYGPASALLKQGFITWLMSLDSTSYDDWVLGGDFNLIRSPENQNKPRGDTNEMNLFNEVISNLDLVEIPFNGRNFSWSNMQEDPLLVKLD